MRSVATLISSALFSLSLAATAQATTVLVELSGTISSVFQVGSGGAGVSIANTFSVGDTVSGSFVYDTEGTLISGNDYSAVTGVSVTINGLSFSSSSDRVRILNDFGGLQEDNIQFGFGRNAASGPIVNGHSPFSLNYSMRAFSSGPNGSSPLSDNSLPDRATFDSFVQAVQANGVFGLAIDFTSPDDPSGQQGVERVFARFDSVQVNEIAAVPLPASLPLLFLGICGIVGLRQRRNYLGLPTGT